MDVMTFIYAGLFILTGVVVGGAMKMQRTTLQLGKYLAGEDILMGATGYQDAITPRSQNYKNYSILSVPILFIIGFFLYSWVIPLISVVIFMITATAVFTINARRNFPLAPQIKKILSALENRSANYAKQGDEVRSEATSEVSDSVEAAFREISEQTNENPGIEDIESLLNSP